MIAGSGAGFHLTSEGSSVHSGSVICNQVTGASSIDVFLEKYGYLWTKQGTSSQLTPQLKTEPQDDVEMDDVS